MVSDMSSTSLSLRFPFPFTCHSPSSSLSPLLVSSLTPHFLYHLLLSLVSCLLPSGDTSRDEEWSK